MPFFKSVFFLLFCLSRQCFIFSDSIDVLALVHYANEQFPSRQTCELSILKNSCTSYIPYYYPKTETFFVGILKISEKKRRIYYVNVSSGKRLAGSTYNQDGIQLKKTMPLKQDILEKLNIPEKEKAAPNKSRCCF